MRDDVVHIKLGAKDRDADAFYFSYGCVVFWGLTSEEERAENALLASLNILNEAVEPLQDTFSYHYGQIAKMQCDTIVLPQIEDPELKSLMKLAVSFGLAQSVKLVTPSIRNAADGCRNFSKSQFSKRLRGRVTFLKRWQSTAGFNRTERT